MTVAVLIFRFLWKRRRCRWTSAARSTTPARNLCVWGQHGTRRRAQHGHAFIQELLVGEGSSCEDYQGLKDEHRHHHDDARRVRRGTRFDVLEQLNSVDALESIKNMRHAVAIDLKEQMAAQGVSDPALISNVSVDNLKIKWPENGLTINTL